MKCISPSLLSADFAHLGDEVQAVLAAGADRLHFDVMDNHYVPNLTMGPLICHALRKQKITVPIDVHLMVTPVDTLVIPFVEAGASSITFHPDATMDVPRTLQLIRSQGIPAGLAINPSVSLDVIQPWLLDIDQLLIMSVNPGFGGQSFMPEILPKIKSARLLIDRSNPKIQLGVDGGIHLGNIASIAHAGADIFVTGSAIFHATDYKNIIQRMHQLTRS